MRAIMRLITSYRIFEKHTTLYLECGHTIMDTVMNEWVVGQRVNCRECLSHLEVLEMFVTNIEE